EVEAIERQSQRVQINALKGCLVTSTMQETQLHSFVRRQLQYPVFIQAQRLTPGRVFDEWDVAVFVPFPVAGDAVGAVHVSMSRRIIRRNGRKVRTARIMQARLGRRVDAGSWQRPSRILISFLNGAVGFAVGTGSVVRARTAERQDCQD